MKLFNNTLNKTLVVGLGYGDEGKGQTVHHLSNNKTIVIRYCGGGQAAHNVKTNENNHTFRLIGSGTYRGAATYITENVFLDPILLKQDMETLAESPYVYINPNAEVVTPYDVYYSQTDKKHLDNGTCGLGIYATKLRSKEISFKVLDLQFPEIINKKLQCIREYYDFPELELNNFLEGCKYLLTYTSYKASNLHVANDTRLIYESTQGVLLDPKIGFPPNTTATSVLPDLPIDDIYGVTRAYSTRHGKGELLHEDYPMELINVKEDNITNDYQEDFRVAPLNIDYLKYSWLKVLSHFDIPISERQSLVISCLDQLTEYPYILNGKVLKAKDEEDFIKIIATNLEYPIIYVRRGASSELEYNKVNYV